MGRKSKEKKEPKAQSASPKPVIWLKAVYHFHVFHYRMPGTAAIAAMTPFVPSPLTVKMAMIAALLQRGEDQRAKQLAPYLPQIEVRIVPPSAAFSFKAFLRYRGVPAVESAANLDESGSLYPSRPHTREYALLASDLVIFVGLPDTKICCLVMEALQNIRYLGCKDAQVWCRSVQEVDQTALQENPVITPLAKGQAGAVVLLADFVPNVSLTLEDLIPGNRQQAHYQCPSPPFVLPGQIKTHGRTRLFLRSSVEQSEDV